MTTKTSCPAPPAVAFSQFLYARLWRSAESVVKRQWFWTVLVALLALWLLYHRTRITSLYFDEAYSIALARQDPVVLWHYIWGPEQNMAVYYLILHDYLGLLHLLHVVPSELIARLPTIVCMALAAVAILLIGWRFFHPLAGVVASVLFTLNPLILQYGQEARAYGLQVLLVCLAWYALFSVLESPSEWRWWLTFAGMSSLAVYAQLTSVFVISSQGLVLLAALLYPHATRTELRRAWPRLLVSAAGMALLIAPMGFDVITYGGENAWVPIATPQDALNFLTVTLCRSSNAFAIALVISSLATLIFVRKLATASVASWLLVPFALSYGLSQPYYNAHVFWPRYLIAIVPAFCLLAGTGVMALAYAFVAGARRLQVRLHLSTTYIYGLSCGLACCLLLLAARIPPRYYATAELQQFRQPMDWLIANYQPGDGLICHPEGPLCAAPTDYYLHVARPNDTRFPTTYAGDWPVAGGPMIHFGIPSNGPALTAYLSQHPRVFVVSAMLGDIHSQLITKHALLQTLAQSHYREVGQYSTPSVQVYLFTYSRVRDPPKNGTKVHIGTVVYESIIFQIPEPTSGLRPGSVT